MERGADVKAAPHDGALRIAVSSYDPAVATDSAEAIARTYGSFLNQRSAAVAESQRSVIAASHERQIGSLADLNRRIAELESVGGNETLDPGLATLRADREVTLELATELQQRLELLDGLGPVRVVRVEPALLSPANIGLGRLAMLGVAVALLSAAVAVAREPMLGWWTSRRERSAVDVRHEEIIDLRDAQQIVAQTPHRPI